MRSGASPERALYASKLYEELSHAWFSGTAAARLNGTVVGTVPGGERARMFSKLYEELSRACLYSGGGREAAAAAAAHLPRSYRGVHR